VGGWFEGVKENEVQRLVFEIAEVLIAENVSDLDTASHMEAFKRCLRQINMARIGIDGNNLCLRCRICDPKGGVPKTRTNLQNSLRLDGTRNGSDERSVKERDGATAVYLSVDPGRFLNLGEEIVTVRV
jgi:hypothetical protein